jgi:hypothetical protein
MAFPNAFLVSLPASLALMLAYFWGRNYRFSWQRWFVFLGSLVPISALRLNILTENSLDFLPPCKETPWFYN